MRLLSLSLKNIRSYREQLITFPQGLVLLSGDVGSGKSTILLAVEFALFGILRGELNASSLLRHGEEEGEVSLSFELEKKRITIRRSLRRSGNSVKQSSGSLVIDGERLSLTPVELRARIHELLGYPEGLLTKGKSLIYRYTVYTPQEEMKRIIFDDVDTRLETLRRLFGIDQYKRARDNLAVLVRDLRGEERVFASRLEELPHKRKSKEVLERERVSIDLESLKVSLEAAQKRLRSEELKVKDANERLEAERVKERRAAELRAQVAERKEQLRRLKERLSIIGNDLAVPLLDPVPVPDNAKEEKLTAQLSTVQERSSKAREQRSVLLAQAARARAAADRLKSLDATCPTCGQKVDEDHRQGLCAVQEKESAEAVQKADNLSAFLERAGRKESELRVALDGLRKDVASAKVAAARREEQNKRRSQLEVEQESLKEQLAKLDSGKDVPVFDPKPLEGAKASLRDQESVRDTARQLFQQSQLSLARAEERLKSFTVRISEVSKDIDALAALQSRLNNVQARRHWLADIHASSLEEVERLVFSSLHQEFSQLFRKWFSQVIDDESLQVSLDASFSPLAVQDGYDVDLSSLSGGEKTAIALSYRLALHQVINEFLSNVNTRGFLVLDEPTDGFSANQLTRLQDLFRALDIEQVILVSHEVQLEGFVDHVLHVSKEEMESNVI